MKCLHCSKTITAKGRYKYCSKECLEIVRDAAWRALAKSQQLAQAIKNREKPRACRTCGEPFTTPLGTPLRQICQDCRDERTVERFRKCVHCGESFDSQKTGTYKVCSKKCRHDWHLEYNRLRMRFIAKENKKDVPCQVCGQIIKNKRPHKFCSVECRTIAWKNKQAPKN